MTGLVVTLGVFFGLAAPLAASAQTEKLHRVGVLSPHSMPAGEMDAFRAGLRELGYLEGRNLRLELRSADGRTERLAELARQLVRVEVDVIFAVNTPAVEAAKKASSTTPIVMARVADPVRSGLVQSLARPGGNVTGITAIPEELSAKRLQLLRDVFPGISRCAILWTAGNPGSDITAKTLQEEAHRIGLQVQALGLQRSAELPALLQSATSQGVQALVLVDDIVITSQKDHILETASAHRLPVLAVWRAFADAGALMSYGPSENATYRRAAFFVDKILRGMRPADLPVEQPTTLELTINLKTAKKLGVAIPAPLLLRADHIIH